MEYAPNGDLLNLVLSSPLPFTQRTVHNFFVQLISGVAYLHSMCFAHRDLKLENLLLDENWDIKISDFGLSRVYAPNELCKTFCGTILYSAPEILWQK